MNTFYNATGKPTTFAAGRSLDLRTEFGAIAGAFDLLPDALGVGQKGFIGGTFQGPSLLSPTFNSASGSFTSFDTLTVQLSSNSSLLAGGAGKFSIGHLSGNNSLVFNYGGTADSFRKLALTDTGNLVIGDGTNALATNATNGFLHIPRCAGTPTGAATAYGSSVPMVYDSTANKIWVRNGGTWRATAALT